MSFSRSTRPVSEALSPRPQSAPHPPSSRPPPPLPSPSPPPSHEDALFSSFAQLGISPPIPASSSSTSAASSSSSSSSPPPSSLSLSSSLFSRLKFRESCLSSLSIRHGECDHLISECGLKKKQKKLKQKFLYRQRLRGQGNKQQEQLLVDVPINHMNPSPFSNIESSSSSSSSSSSTTSVSLPSASASSAPFIPISRVADFSVFGAGGRTAEVQQKEKRLREIKEWKIERKQFIAKLKKLKERLQSEEENQNYEKNIIHNEEKHNEKNENNNNSSINNNINNNNNNDNKRKKEKENEWKEGDYMAHGQRMNWKREIKILKEFIRFYDQYFQKLSQSLDSSSSHSTHDEKEDSSSFSSVSSHRPSSSSLSSSPDSGPSDSWKDRFHSYRAIVSLDARIVSDYKKGLKDQYKKLYSVDQIREKFKQQRQNNQIHEKQVENMFENRPFTPQHLPIQILSNQSSSLPLSARSVSLSSSPSPPLSLSPFSSARSTSDEGWRSFRSDSDLPSTYRSSSSRSSSSSVPTSSSFSLASSSGSASSSPYFINFSHRPPTSFGGSLSRSQRDVFGLNKIAKNEKEIQREREKRERRKEERIIMGNIKEETKDEEERAESGVGSGNGDTEWIGPVNLTLEENGNDTAETEALHHDDDYNRNINNDINGEIIPTLPIPFEDSSADPDLFPPPLHDHVSLASSPPPLSTPGRLSSLSGRPPSAPFSSSTPPLFPPPPSHPHSHLYPHPPSRSSPSPSPRLLFLSTPSLRPSSSLAIGHSHSDYNSLRGINRSDIITTERKIMKQRKQQMIREMEIIRNGKGKNYSPASTEFEEMSKMQEQQENILKRKREKQRRGKEGEDEVNNDDYENGDMARQFDFQSDARIPAPVAVSVAPQPPLQPPPTATSVIPSSLNECRNRTSHDLYLKPNRFQSTIQPLHLVLS